MVVFVKGGVCRVRDIGRRDARVIPATRRHTPARRTVLTAGEDNRVRLWNAATGRLLGQPLEHPGVSVAAFSPDGQRVLTAGASFGSAPPVPSSFVP